MMAKLTTEQRNNMPANEFAGPDRSYPIPDASHARNAIARASQQRNRGGLANTDYEAIVRKARSKLK